MCSPLMRAPVDLKNNLFVNKTMRRERIWERELRREREKRERWERERRRPGVYVNVVGVITLIFFAIVLFMFFFRQSKLVDYVTEFNNLPDAEKIRRLQTFDALQDSFNTFNIRIH